MKVLLTGPLRAGKSRVLRQLAQSYPGNCGGVLVGEIRDRARKRSGFELQVVWSGPGRPLQVLDRAVLARLEPWSPIRVDRYWINPAALSLGVQALDAAMHEGGLVLVDEIGPLQIISEPFRDAVRRCLDGPVRLVGSISQAPDPFLEEVRNRPGVRLLEVTRHNSRHLAEGLSRWLCGAQAGAQP